jgi:hypothetical protein
MATTFLKTPRGVERMAVFETGFDQVHSIMWQ